MHDFGFELLWCVCVVSGKEGQCVYHGLTMFDESVWSPEPCVTCLCTRGRVVCDRIICPTKHCHFPFTPAGDCCPVCMEPGRNTTCGYAMMQHPRATETSNVSDSQGLWVLFTQNLKISTLKIFKNVFKERPSVELDQCTICLQFKVPGLLFIL